MFGDDSSKFGDSDWREEFVRSSVRPFLAGHRSALAAGVREWLNEIRVEGHPLPHFPFTWPRGISVPEGWAVLLVVHDLACVSWEQIAPALEDLDLHDRMALAGLSDRAERLTHGHQVDLWFLLGRLSFVVDNADMEFDLGWAECEGGASRPSGRRPRKKPCPTRVAQERIKAFIEQCRRERKQRPPTIVEICAATDLAKGTVSQSQHYQEYVAEFERSASAAHRTIPLTPEMLASRPDGRSVDPVDIAIGREEATDEEIYEDFLEIAETSEERHQWAAVSPADRRALIDRLRAQDRERSRRR
jgi:hypothetical protein